MRFKSGRSCVFEVSVLCGTDHSHTGFQERSMQLGSREMG